MMLVIRFLHLLAAALWMGAALWWPGALRRALAGDLAHAGGALGQARRGTRVDLIAAVTTIATGLLYLWILPPRGAGTGAGIWLGGGLAVARVGMLYGMALPALRQVEAAVGAGDSAAALATSRRLPAYAGAAHLTWLLALAAMVFL